MQGLLDLWAIHFDDYRFVDVASILDDGPCSLSDFVDLAQEQCKGTRSILEREWLPSTVALITQLRDTWDGIVQSAPDAVDGIRRLSTLCSPKDPGFSQLELLFKSIATLMGNQLRGCVTASLRDLSAEFEKHKDGSAYEGEYDATAFMTRDQVIDTVVDVNITLSCR